MEERRPAAAGVEALIRRHDAGTALVQFTATSASETQLDGKPSANFTVFEYRLQQAGLGHLPSLKPIAIFDLGYWDQMVWANDSDVDDLKRIHAVLFPSLPFDLQADASMSIEDQEKAERKWRNYRLDGLGLYTHIQSGADVFVTSDRNFTKQAKKAPLAALGAQLILDPLEAKAYAASH